MDDNAIYAKLLTSVKSSGQRPLSPIQTAELIERLANEEGKDEVELLLSIGKDMISYFLRLKNGLPEQCHSAVLWGQSNDLGVGFTAAHYIATLDKEVDKIMLFSACSKQKIPKEDIKKIISSARKLDLSIEKAIEHVTSMKPRIITTYMVVLAISEDSIKKLEEKSSQENKRSDEIFTNSFKEKFKIEKIDDFKIQGKNLAFSLSESDYKNYKKQVNNLRLVFDEITSHIIG